MLPSHVAPSQVPGFGGQLSNWSGDEVRMVLIRLKNDLGMLQKGLILSKICRTKNKCCTAEEL